MNKPGTIDPDDLISKALLSEEEIPEYNPTDPRHNQGLLPVEEETTPVVQQNGTPAPDETSPGEPGAPPEPVKTDPDAEPVEPKATVPEIVPNSRNLRSQLLKANEEKRTLEDRITKLEEEKTAEITRLREEIEQIKSAAPAEQQPVVPARKLTQEEILQMPQVKEPLNKLRNLIDTTETVLGPEDGRKLKANFNKWLGTFLELPGLTGEAREVALRDLHEHIANEVGADNKRDVLSCLTNAAPAYEEYTRQLRQIEADSESAYVRQELERYTATEREFYGALAALGEAPDAVVEAKPYAVESFLTTLVKSDPTVAKKAALAKKEIAEIMAGFKPLSPEDRKKLAENNLGGLSDAEQNRLTGFRKKQTEAARHLFVGRMLIPLLPAILEELQILRDAADGSESERDALDDLPEASAPKKTAAPKKEPHPDEYIYKAFSGEEIPDPK